MESTPLPESVDGNRKTTRQFEAAYVTKGERGTSKWRSSQVRDPSPHRFQKLRNIRGTRKSMIRVRLFDFAGPDGIRCLSCNNFKAAALVLVKIAHLTFGSVCRIRQPCHGVQFGFPLHGPAARWAAPAKSAAPSLRNQVARRIFPTTFTHRLAKAARFSANIPHDQRRRA
jgi:hypothetical protein